MSIMEENYLVDELSFRKNVPALLSASEEIPWFLLINEPLFYSLLSFLWPSSPCLMFKGWFIFEILQMTLSKPFMMSYMVSHSQWRHCLNDVSDNRCRDQCNPSLVLVLPTRPCLHHVALLFFCTAMFVSFVTRAIGLATPGMIVTYLFWLLNQNFS